MAERDAELKTAVQQFERQRDSYVQRIGEATDPQLKQTWIEELRRLVNPRSAILAKYEPRLNELDAALTERQTELDQARRTADPLSASQRARLTDRKNELLAQLDATNARWAQRVDVARQRLAEAQELQGHKAEALAALNTRLSEIGAQLAALDSERIPMSRQDQIRRIAGRFLGKNAEDVSVEEADVVALVWFGSLALLAALTGPLTAIVALGLQRIAAEHKPHESRLSRLVRRMLLSWRWRRTKTEKVIVKVPVEKEVEKRVEVPVEVEKIIQEILYVPILTDDPEALRTALRNEVPPEVADLVRLSIQGQRGEGPA